MSTDYRIQIPDSELAELHRRVAATRLPNVLPGQAAKGFPLERVQALLDAWPTFDWRAVEARLNCHEQRVVDVDGLAVHVLRARGGDRLPVVLLHGWADSILGVAHLIEPLTAAGHDVIVPSPPGYALSGQPLAQMSTESSAEAVAAAVAALGVERYALHGGDWGAALAEAIALAHPDRVAALHLTDPGFHHVFEVDPADAVDDAERDFLAARDGWDDTGAYVAIQSTQPLTLAYGLADSPVGLLAWLAEKRWAWTDRDPATEDVLALATLVWCTNTIYSSMRLYAEGMGDWSDESAWGESDGDGDAAAGAWGDATPDGGDVAGGWGEATPDDAATTADDGAAAWSSPVCTVPTAFALMPRDILQPPRSFVERFYGDVRRFTLMPAGGHFAASDEPAALAADLLAFLDEV